MDGGQGRRRSVDLRCSGLAVNVAARLRDLAGTGEVLASAAVVGLTMGKGFSFSDAGAMELKGLSAPVLAYRLEFASGESDSQGGGG